MTIVYKILQENELQYVANKNHIKTAERISRQNSNTKLLQEPFNKKKT